MSLLLKEIQQIDEKAADVLQLADLQTDSDIEVLTREELLQLFPAVTDIKLRRAIYNVIHKQVQALQMPEVKKCRKLAIDQNHKREVELVLNKLKEFIPTESFRAALTDDGVLVDYLRILKDMKTQMDNVQGFLDAHISLLEEFSKNHPDQESANCGPVTDSCPGEARGESSARGSGTADARGKKTQKTGNTGHRPETQKSSSVAGRPAEVHSGKSDGRARGAPGSGTSDIGDPVGLSTGLTGGHPPQGTQKSSSVAGRPAEVHSGKSDGRARGAPGSGTSDIGDPVGLSTGLTGGHPPQGTQKSSSVAGGPAEVHSGKSDGRARGAPATLYKMVVSGKTFDTHLKLMETVEKRVQNQLRPCEGNGDNQITFVFCPISSRIASDVEAAMSNVKDDKPVILVLMHHTREVRQTTSVRTWHDDARVVLHVNVFYHETVGLLKCDRNDAAVTEIQTKLMERFIQGEVMSLLPNEIQHIDERAADMLKPTLYKMVVSGKTFDTHLKLMETVEKRVQNQLRPCEGNGDNQITFVFCPISSRIASDVEAAMSNVKDDKPVILVLMHHTREVRQTTSVRTWHDDARVVLHVNVFYHETVGLLKCDRNDAAVTEIQTKLMERFIQGEVMSLLPNEIQHIDERAADMLKPTLYKMVVSGKTFDTHLKLMETVEKRVQNQLRPCEGNGDNQITFVFCPISSRIASDVEAAMSNVKDDKPVILVLMHHTREVRPTTSMRTWHDDARVVLHVNVFYHETVGLLKCDRNDAAVTEIQTKLMERFIQGVDADHGATDQKVSGYRITNWFSSKKLL